MRRTYNTFIPITYYIIFLCLTYENVYAQSTASVSSQTSTDPTSTVKETTTDLTSVVSDTTTESTTITASIIPADRTTEFTTITASIIPADTTLNNDNNTTTTVMDGKPRCAPGEYPFANICISPLVNGSVLIAALALSTLSFIGVIIVGSCLLCCRKDSRDRKQHLVASYNISDKTPPRSSTQPDTEYSSTSLSERPARPHMSKTPNLEAIPLKPITTTTTHGNPDRVHANVLDRQPGMKMANVKQLHRPGPNPNKNQGKTGPPLVQSDYF
ncbi:unnamed protein product [Adineta ricciae]|uniref:Uncharacterized protein n=1 Tax=Adineta ricciae TaxID=249248 RepID=A0A814F5M5_ADIRI|nr:unnamed protein product [Adineta ricciae]